MILPTVGDSSDKVDGCDIAEIEDFGYENSQICHLYRKIVDNKFCLQHRLLKSKTIS